MISTAKLTTGRPAMMMNRLMAATRPGNTTSSNNTASSMLKAMQQQQQQRFMSVINISDFEATEKFSQLNHKSVLYFTGVCCLCVCVCVCVCVSSSSITIFSASLLPQLCVCSHFILSLSISLLSIKQLGKWR